MKLVYLANISLLAGWAHEIQITKMCEAFAGFEIGVELVVPRRRNEIKADPFDYYGVKRNFKITKLPCLDLCPGSSRSFYFWLRLISFLLSAKIYLFFKKFDILYTRDGFFCFLATLLGKKNIFWEINDRIVKRVPQKFNGVIVVTRALKDFYVNKGIRPENILVAPNGADLKEFNIQISKEETREKLGLPQDKKLIGYLGMLRTMGMEKGVDVAIKSLGNLPDEVCLVIVGGDSEDINFYQEFARRSGLDERIMFVGKIPHADTSLYLKAFNVLIAPFPENEHYKFYMSPIKMFEYMASRRPIVASDLPSIREILNENNAILVKPDNPATLAEGIKKLLQDPNLSDKISEQAFRDVQEYTWVKRAESILKFINQE